MMLPPIRKSSNAPLGGAAYSAAAAPGKRSGEPGAALFAERSLRDEPQHSPTTALASSPSSFVVERIYALERENELMRAELSHVRQHLSSNQQQRDDERVRGGRFAAPERSFYRFGFSDELQRLVHAFNSKLQADSVFQQREQQKCALLFAEVARLGHSVESGELAVKAVGDDARRRVKLLEQQLQFSTTAKQQQAAYTSLQRGEEVQQQVEELQHAMALTKAALAQFRADAETERSERWRVDSERNQWLADLRTAVAKVDASVDAKLGFHVERLSSRLTADRMDTVRLLEEHRELVAGADLKRSSGQMLELSRVSDHVLALERWVHTEFGHIKRVFQFVLADTDGRLQAVAGELAASVRSQSAMLFHLEDEHSARLRDIHDAVRDVAHAVQTKLSALEDVVPMEVKARQQHDDALRRRVEGVVKALSTAIAVVRDECAALHAQLRARVAAVEDAQRGSADQVDEAHEAVKETIRAFLRDSDAMLTHLAEAVELERGKALTAGPPAVVGSGSAADAKGSEEASHAQCELERLVAVALEAPDARPEWVAYCKAQISSSVTELRGGLLSDIDRRLEPLAELPATRALVERQGLMVENLRAWTASHAHECRQCYEYLTWAVDSLKTDDAVSRCLAAVVDRVADDAALGEFEALEDATSWAVQQLATSRVQAQLPLDTEPSSEDDSSVAADPVAVADPELWL
ncbi:hypothetical protein PybrP1_005796 [[Pythium] brassicae (nom. inval.)]|nr:hypothetical protein PybrP1_005796 [[Pythium] brassicae (nom. inval.)]